jgi:hypothetical protein
MTSENRRRRASDRPGERDPADPGFSPSRSREDGSVPPQEERRETSVERRQRDLEWNSPERRASPW